MSPVQYQHEDEDACDVALQLANAGMFPLVLKSAIELKIFDLLFTATSGGSWLAPSEIAGRIPTQNPDASSMIDRMLSFLASYDLVKCTVNTKENGEVERLFGAGPLCKYLKRSQNEEGSVGSFLLVCYDEVSIKSWYHLNDAIMEGGIPFNRAHGMAAFEYPATDQRFNKVFNLAMSSYSPLIMNKILRIYKGFDGIKVLVDVGGGTGIILNMIVSRYPQIQGINYDLPHVVSEAPPYAGIDHVGGDMFTDVPKGDAIFMKWILHDWSDEYCLKLLKNCCKALPNHGKLIVIDSILSSRPENNVTSQIVFGKDMFMLGQCPGGKERTQKEFEALASKSGFSRCQLKCSAHCNWVMEFHKSS